MYIMSENINITIGTIIFIVVLEKINMLPCLINKELLKLLILFTVNYLTILKYNMSDMDKLLTSLFYAAVGYVVLFYVGKINYENFQNEQSSTVILYKSINYNGNAVNVSDGEYPSNSDLIENQIANDNIQSIFIPPGKLVVLFSDDINQGSYIFLQNSVPDLSKILDPNNSNMDWSKNMSSLIVRSTNMIMLYNKPNFQGVGVPIASSGSFETSSDLIQKEIGQKQLYSLIVPPSFEVTLFENDLNSGNSLKVTFPGINDLSKITDSNNTDFTWDNQTSSLIVNTKTIESEILNIAPSMTLTSSNLLKSQAVPYDNGKVYNGGDKVMFNEDVYSLIIPIGTNGYSPSNSPQNWSNLTNPSQNYKDGDPYNNNIIYQVGNIVTLNNNSYILKSSIGASGFSPDSNNNWSLADSAAAIASTSSSNAAVNSIGNTNYSVGSVTTTSSTPVDLNCSLTGEFNVAGDKLYTQYNCETIINGTWVEAVEMPGFGECLYKDGGSHSYECRQK